MDSSNNGALHQWLQIASKFDLGGRCKLLWTDGNPFFDAKVKVIGRDGEATEVFEVHKLILAMGSKMMATALYDSTVGESSSIIEITSVRPSLMKSVLEFLYTDHIRKSLDWPEIGGLCFAAKELGIPRLIEKWEQHLEEKLSCEAVLNLYKGILTTRDVKWPKEYYTELLELCIAYILKNGEVILRAKNLRKLTFEQIELFLGSDFLVVFDELDVFNALIRWAKFQRKHPASETKNDELKMYKETLRIGKNPENFGLLNHVRFSLLDSNQSIFRKWQDLIPDQVYQTQILAEPDEISEKKRWKDVNSENIVEFRNHVGSLSKSAISKVYGDVSEQRSPAKGYTTDSDSGFSQVSPPTQTSKAKGFQSTTANNQKISSSSQLASVFGTQSDRNENLANIKVELDMDEDEEILTTPTPLTIKLGERGRIILKIEANTSSNDLVGSSSNPSAKTTNNISPMKRKMVIENEATKIKRPYSKNKPTSHGGSASTNTDKSATQGEEQVYLKKAEKIKYKKIIEECKSRPTITKIVLAEVVIKRDSNMSREFPSVCLSEMTEFTVIGKFGDKVSATLLQNLMTIDLEQLIFFYRVDANMKNRLSDLWTSRVNVNVSFDGVVVFKINPFELTLNFTKKSAFHDLAAHKLPLIQSLNLGHYAFSEKSWLQKQYAENITDLRLVNVSNLKMEILTDFKSLKVLSIWPAISQSPILCLDQKISDRLCSIAIYSHLVRFTSKDQREFKNVTELFLAECSWEPEFASHIKKSFPNLKKVFITSKYSALDPDLLDAFFSIQGIQEIGVWNFNLQSFKKPTHEKMKELLASLKFNKGSSAISFKVKQEGGKWTGEGVTKQDLAKQIFESFGFENFYKFETWNKHFWAKYDDY